MLHVALFEPEIPPNTGNIIRLCANSGAHLHLIHPLGFAWDDKRMRRAGLDYHEWAAINHYRDLRDFQHQNQQRRIFACSTKGQKNYSEIHYEKEDLFLFGAETRGLPSEVREYYPLLKIPMLAHSRSINLANSVAIVLYEAWRQLGFAR